MTDNIPDQSWRELSSDRSDAPVTTHLVSWEGQMNPIDQIVMAFLKLLGLVKDEPKPVAEATPAAAPPPPPQPEPEEVEEEEEDPAQEEWRELQEYIARVEGHGIDLAGIEMADPVSFWAKYFAIEEAEAQGGSRDEAIVQQGFQNADHWEMVSTYIQAKWSELVTNEDDELEVRQRDDFTNGALQARQGQMQQQMTDQAAANPQLLEPVEGVAVEQWAQIAAGMTQLPQGATADDVNQYLLGFGMDRAKYDVVNNEWTARMSQDHSMVISNAYSAAFTGSMGVPAGGDEPCTFEQYVEIMVAQEAWAEQGMDVNAQLTAVFGIDAATYGAWSGHWSPKMGTDVALMNQYSQLRETYIQKYAGAGLDDDLDL